MDPFSAVGTIVGLLGVALQLKTSLSRCIHATSAGPSEVRALTTDLKNIEFPLTRLENILKLPQNQQDGGKATPFLPEEITKELHGVLVECRRVVDELAGLVEASKLDSSSYRAGTGASGSGRWSWDGENSGLSKMKNQWAKWKFGWGSGMRDVERLKGELAMHKSALSFTILLITFSTTNNIEQTTARIEDKVREVRKAIEKVERAAEEDASWDPQEVQEGEGVTATSSFLIERYLNSAASIYTASRPASPVSTPAESPTVARGGEGLEKRYRRICPLPIDDGRSIGGNDSGIDVEDDHDADVPEMDKAVMVDVKVEDGVQVKTPKKQQQRLREHDRTGTLPRPLVHVGPITISHSSHDQSTSAVELVSSAYTSTPSNSLDLAPKTTLPRRAPPSSRTLTPNLLPSDAKQTERTRELTAIACRVFPKFTELGKGKGREGRSPSLQNPVRASSTATPTPLPTAIAEYYVNDGCGGMEVVSLGPGSVDGGEYGDAIDEKRASVMYSPPDSPAKASGGMVKEKIGGLGYPSMVSENGSLVLAPGGGALSSRQTRAISPPQQKPNRNIYSPGTLRRPFTVPPRVGGGSDISSEVTPPPPLPPQQSPPIPPKSSDYNNPVSYPTHPPPSSVYPLRARVSSTHRATPQTHAISCNRPGCRHYWTLGRILRLWLACLMLLMARKAHIHTRNSVWRKMLGRFAGDLAGVVGRWAVGVGMGVGVGVAGPVVTGEAGGVAGWYLGLLREGVVNAGREGIMSRAGSSRSVAGGVRAGGGRIAGATGGEMVKIAALAGGAAGWGVGKVVGLLAEAPVL